LQHIKNLFFGVTVKLLPLYDGFTVVLSPKGDIEAFRYRLKEEGEE